MPRMRIQKALSEAGVASRRSAEEMVLEGRVSVDGQVVRELPFFVDTDSQQIRIDGQRVRRLSPTKLYVLLNKPKGVVCTMSDPQGRPRAVDLIPPTRERLYTVGRLDVESTGIILITNDGELTQKLTHPRYEVEKRYVVEVDGLPGPEAMQKLQAGVYLDGKRTAGARVKILKRSPKQSLLEIALREGRNREIRRMLAGLGHKVRRLKRVGIGPLSDHGLKVGSFRLLRPEEVAKLRRTAEADSSPQRHRGHRE